MSFFKIRTTRTNAEFVPLKLCIAAAYILAGTYFHNFFSKNYIPVIIIFIVPVIWSVYLWVTKMKNEKQE
jgi:hypothetical protein